MKGIFERLPEQVRRLFVVLTLLIGGTFFLFFVLIPRPFRDRELQKKMAVERIKSKDVKYAGSSVCADCHDAEYSSKKTGYHKNLSCETCHGAAAKHADDPASGKPFVPEEREFCAHCHTYNPSRPTGFPQINPAAHNPMKRCMMCHNPHNPKPPETPHECSACHTSIARTKAVSAHVLLSCTVCHTSPENHKVSPLTIKPTIPSKREFCGQCHSKTSKVKGIPKIDIVTHGEKYLCWQCHYPHMPEAHSHASEEKQ